MSGSVSVDSDWRRAGLDVSLAISASMSRCNWVAVSGTSRKNSMLAMRPSLASKRTGRSEEHTSELQSLMRISYAVFCLKKKKIEDQSKITTYDKRKNNINA